MTAAKKFRYYYWLVKSFISKNVRLIAVSFIISFFLIFLSINFFPILNSLILKKNDKIGIIGHYTISSLPTEITSLVSNPLITVSDKGQLLPVLVNSWELSNGDKTYRFHIKPNLFWSDGTKFKAADLKYDFKGIKKKVIDDTTIEFELVKPLSIFPIYLTSPIIRYPLQGVAGVYEMQSFKSSKNELSSLTLYPNKKELPSKTYFFYPNEDELVAAYKRGEINFIKTSKKNIASQFSSWKNTNVTKSVNYDQMLTVFFNTSDGPTSEKDFRKALILAVPDFNDLGEKATGPILPASWGYSQDVKKYFFNISKARDSLDKSLSSTESAALNIYTFYDYVNAANDIKKNLDSIGVKTNLKIVSYRPTDFDIFITMWSPPTDPDQYYFWHSTQEGENITKYKNVRIDKLLEDGRDTVDIEERKDIYADFQRLILEEVPAYFVYHPFSYTIERK